MLASRWIIVQVEAKILSVSRNILMFMFCLNHVACRDFDQTGPHGGEVAFEKVNHPGRYRISVVDSRHLNSEVRCTIAQTTKKSVYILHSNSLDLELRIIFENSHDLKFSTMSTSKIFEAENILLIKNTGLQLSDSDDITGPMVLGAGILVGSGTLGAVLLRKKKFSPPVPLI